MPRADRNMNAVLGASGVLMALAIGLGGCTRSSGVSDVLVVESDFLLNRTVPSGARLLGRSGLKQEPLRVTQEWQISTNRSWKDYSEDVLRVLPSDYRCSQKSDPALICLRDLPGDILWIVLSPDLAAGEPVVRVHLEARPD